MELLTLANQTPSRAQLRHGAEVRLQTGAETQPPVARREVFWLSIPFDDLGTWAYSGDLGTGDLGTGDLVIWEHDNFWIWWFWETWADSEWWAIFLIEYDRISWEIYVNIIWMRIHHHSEWEYHHISWKYVWISWERMRMWWNVRRCCAWWKFS